MSHEMKGAVAVHICAPNDVNGNPQRCFAVLQGEDVLAVIDEGYEGEGALRGLRASLRASHYIPVSPHRVNVSVTEYKRWLTIGETRGSVVE